MKGGSDCALLVWKLWGIDCAQGEALPYNIKPSEESGTETMRKVLAEGSPRSPRCPHKEPALWSKILLSESLQQALNYASPHFITQQAHLSFNLICIEQAEAGYKAAKPKEWKCSTFSDYRTP